MVKIQTICRSDKEYVRETKQDINKVHRNTNPTLHQFQKPREYQRALISTKLDKIFAKPFVGNLSGHSDTISCFAKSPNSLTNFLSGSYDGEIRFWDLSQRKYLFQINAHQNYIKGLTFSRTGSCFLSSGDDKCINLYELDKCLNSLSSLNKIQNNGILTQIQPSNKYVSKIVLGNVDHSWDNSTFASSGQIVQIWSYERSQPVQTFEWGADSVLKVKFNPSQPNILLGSGMDRGIVLYDLRGNTPLKKTILNNKSNALCWNPQEPINFTVGNDDGNCYTFDMRKLDIIKQIHKDHIQAIMDIDYNPTGQEFVTGSYDKTIRIFGTDQGKSKEVYHGQRMQKVFCVNWSQDSEYILSGSEDMNIRIWKANASKPMGNMNARHKAQFQYKQKLKEKFQYNKEIRKIAKHRHLPKYIQNNKQKKQIQLESKHRKLKNQELNNPNKFVKPKAERLQKIAEVQE